MPVIIRHVGQLCYEPIKIIVTNVVFRPDVGRVERVFVEQDECEIFDATLYGVETGVGLGAIELTGPVET